MSQTRRLAAILAADVAGYSRLMGADEEGTLERLKALRRELLDPKLAEHHGRIVKTTGDGLLVEFASAVDAVRCGVAVQRAMPERNTGFPAGTASSCASASILATSSSRATTSTATASTVLIRHRSGATELGCASPRARRWTLVATPLPNPADLPPAAPPVGPDVCRPPV
jgi:class 3 adenylate cyclase